MKQLTFYFALAFIFTVPWEETLDTSSFGTLTKFIGILVALAWIVQASATGRTRPLRAVHATAFCFVMWSGLTIFWSLNPKASMSGLVTGLQLLVMSILIWDIFDSREKIVAALQAYVLGSYVAVGGIFLAWMSGETTVYRRYAAPGADVDNSALILAIAIPAAFHLMFGQNGVRHRGLRFLYLAFIPLACFAMVLTGTRGALIALIPSLAIMLLALLRAGTAGRLIALTLVILSIGAVVNYAPPELISRVTHSANESTGGSAQDPTTGRTNIWRQSLEAFAHHPVLGVGHNAHRAAIPLGQVAHNTPLSILTETGLVGFTIFVAFLFHVVKIVRRDLFKESGYWFAQLSVIAVDMLTLTEEDRKAVWVIASLAIAAASVSTVKEPAVEESELPTPVGRRVASSVTA